MSFKPCLEADKGGEGGFDGGFGGSVMRRARPEKTPWVSCAWCEWCNERTGVRGLGMGSSWAFLVGQ